MVAGTALPAGAWIEVIVYGSLAVLGLATTGKGTWWALKGLLVVVLLAGLVGP